MHGLSVEIAIIEQVYMILYINNTSEKKHIWSTDGNLIHIQNILFLVKRGGGDQFGTRLPFLPILS